MRTMTTTALVRQFTALTLVTGVALATAVSAPAQQIHSVVNAGDSGPGSLRAALAAANSGDVIEFDESLRGATITLAGEELLIDKDLEILGPGDGQLAISGDRRSRVFVIAPGVEVSLAGLTIRDAVSVGAHTGGGIENWGTLTVSTCVLSDNYANLGGGIATCGTLEVRDCTFVGNSAWSGGAIDNYGGTVTLERCTLSENEASGGGGAVCNSVGTLTIRSSTVSNNVAFEWGGGILNYGGTLSLRDSTLSGNTVPGDFTFGGGIYNDAAYDHDSDTIYPGTLTVSNCTLWGNSAYNAGGIFNGWGGDAIISDCTLSDNVARGGVPQGIGWGSYMIPHWGAGGGIYNDGQMTISGCTLSGNAVANGYAGGGGIYNGFRLTLSGSTVTANSAYSKGGGIYNDAFSTLNITNKSTVTKNKAPNGADLYNEGSYTIEKGSTVGKSPGGGPKK